MGKPNPKHRKFQKKDFSNITKLSTNSYINPKFKRRYPEWLDSFNPESLKTMEMDEIILILAKMGIKSSGDSLLEVLSRSHSCQEVSDRWNEILKSKQRFDMIYYFDRNWGLSRVVAEIWHRILPEKLSAEDIDDLMEEFYRNNGYDSEKASQISNQIWDWIYAFLKKGLFLSTEKIDHLYPNSYGYDNWIGDYLEFLTEMKEYQLVIEKCDILLKHLKQSSLSFIENIKKLKAEAFLHLGKEDLGIKLYNDLLKEYPDDIFLDIALGDYFSQIITRIPRMEPDYKKGLQIYENAKKKFRKTRHFDNELLEILNDRIEDIYDLSDLERTI